MVPGKPKLLYTAEIRRNRYFRRFMWLLLAVVAAGAAFMALDEAAAREAADGDVLQIGKIVALGVVILLAVRALLNLLHFFTTRNESVRIYDRGLVWQRGKKQYKYSWAQLKAFRDGARTRKLLGRSIFHTGAHTFEMRDCQTFKLTWKHGNIDDVSKAIDPYIADTIGTMMGKALRNSKSVQVNPKLSMNKNGIVAGDTRIPWSRVDVRVQNGKLTILEMTPEKKFQTVRRYDTRKVDNLAGFLDVADGIIRSHQRDRF